MKFKVSKKDMRHEKVYRVGYCSLQFLLRYEQPIAYSSGQYGWACDYYKVGDVYICTGYSTIGKEVGYRLTKKYDELARRVEAPTYDGVKSKVSKLLKRFMAELLKN